MRMHSFSRRLLAGAALTALAALGAAASAQDADPILRDVIVVTGAPLTAQTERRLTPHAAPFQTSDITYATARVPGGARIANGALSGQMQYRGLFGERLNLRIDGQRFASGGPNLMDPAFHYAPALLIAEIVVDRGVSPVSEGPGLAGGADAVYRRVDFASGLEPELGYALTLSGRSANDGVSAGGVVGASTDQWRFNILGAWDEAEDARFADGEIGGTAFERGVFGLSAGVRSELGALSLDLRRHETGPSGNPPFPMDIQYVDADMARLSYDWDGGGFGIEAEFGYVAVEHLMDNFSLRPSPPPMRHRATFTEAETISAALGLRFDMSAGSLRVGVDGERVTHDGTITNPNSAGFFLTPFPDVSLDRVGAFAEWNGGLGALQSQLGIRVDRHEHAAGEARLGPALPMGPTILADAFNAADRATDEVTVDAVARLWTQARHGVSWRATFARKQQTPGYIQRFGWAPLNASGGLADGNIYIGDVTLSPETAWIAEAGFDYAGRRAYLRPTVYLRRIDDYIQGAPFDDTVGVIDTTVERIAAMNGDPTPLRWANVDARLYGVDVDAGYDIPGPLRVDAVASVVRGERRDIDDNLYRVAAPSLTVDLTWEAASWAATLQTRLVADQNDVSLTNSEATTDGYAVISAHADWRISEGVGLAFGVENLFDEVYADHLSGYNRNGFGEVAVGERVPGPGRGVFVRLNLSN